MTVWLELSDMAQIQADSVYVSRWVIVKCAKDNSPIQVQDCQLKLLHQPSTVETVSIQGTGVNTLEWALSVMFHDEGAPVRKGNFNSKRRRSCAVAQVGSRVLEINTRGHGESIISTGLVIRGEVPEAADACGAK